MNYSHSSIDSLEASSKIKYILDYNEYNGAIHPDTKLAYNNAMNYLSTYYRSGACNLKSTIARVFNLPIDYISIVNGADDGLDNFLKIAKSKLGVKSWATTYSFTYDHFKVFAKQHSITQTDFESADLIYICTPNNPTGEITSVSEIKTLCQLYPQKHFCIDLSYLTYGTENIWERFNEILAYKNATIIFSTAKIFPMSGLRTGVVLSTNEFVSDYFTNEYNHKLVGMVARSVAESCFKNFSFYLAQTKSILQTREDFSRWLIQKFAQGLNLNPVIPDGGNFVLLQGSKKELLLLQQRLYQFEIQVRYKSGWDFVRVTAVPPHILNQLRSY